MRLGLYSLKVAVNHKTIEFSIEIRLVFGNYRIYCVVITFRTSVIKAGTMKRTNNLSMIYDDICSVDSFD